MSVLDGLTPREKRAALLLAEGNNSQKEIAALFGVAYGTVKNIFKRIYEKTGCDDSIHLVATIWRERLNEVRPLSPPPHS